MAHVFQNMKSAKAFLLNISGLKYNSKEDVLGGIQFQGRSQKIVPTLKCSNNKPRFKSEPEAKQPGKLLHALRSLLSLLLIPHTGPKAAPPEHELRLNTNFPCKP